MYDLNTIKAMNHNRKGDVPNDPDYESPDIYRDTEAQAAQGTIDRAIEAMRRAGAIMRFDRCDFNFGEYAGESEREIIESVTGLDYDALSPEDVDALCGAYLGF